LGTCLSNLYHEYKKSIKAGYAKFDTFPIWDMPLNHMVNIAYEAAIADLRDENGEAERIAWLRGAFNPHTYPRR
jgi:uncharacterized protein (UPF0371 family)